MLKIYRASAGSGKTFRLTLDYLHLLFDKNNLSKHRRILAVTFTNKATEEMKSRILNELFRLSKGEASDYRKELEEKHSMSAEQVNDTAKKLLSGILHDYGSFSVSTIDKFFQQIIRAFAREIGVHGGYNLEIESDQTLQQSVDNLFIELSDEKNRQLLAWLTEFAEERIEDAKKWNLKNDILDLGKHIFKENFQSKAEECNLKIHDKTFLKDYRHSLREIRTGFETTAKAKAKALLEIIDRNGITLENFKGGSRSAMKLLEKPANDNFEIDMEKLIPFTEDVTNCYAGKTPKPIMSAIENAYDNGLQSGLEDFIQWYSEAFLIYNSSVLILKYIGLLGIINDISQQIKNLTTEENSMLISDTNMLLNKIIDNSETPFVYEKTGINIDHFMIDEFQDTSVLQWKNFQPLISNSLASGKFNLVVGDVKQSIYRWRNSDWKILDSQISKTFNGGQTEEESLDTNWRSDKNIIGFNNAFFAMAAQLLQSRLNENLTRLTDVFHELRPLTNIINNAYQHVAQKPSQKAGPGHVKIEFIDKTENEDGWRAESLNRLQTVVETLEDNGFSPKEIAILVRTNKEAQEVVQKLLACKAASTDRHYCYDVMGNEGLAVSNSSAVRFILGVLQLFVNNKDEVQRTIVRYEFARNNLGLSESEALQHAFTNEMFSPAETAKMHHLRLGSMFETVENIIREFQLDQWHNESVFIQSFQDIVFRFTTSNKNSDLNSFLKWWKQNGDKQFVATPDNMDAIRVMTIHKSKGLDFKAVVVPFCDWDTENTRNSNIMWCSPAVAPFDKMPLIPVEYSKKLGKSIFALEYYKEQTLQLIDSLNVAYVAFTRAKHELICMAPAPVKKEEEIVPNSIASLMFLCFSNGTDLADHFDKDNRIFEVGTSTRLPEKPVSSETTDAAESYPIAGTSTRLRLKLSGTTSPDKLQELKESRLTYGLLMHEILCGISYRDDQEKALDEMLCNGRISRNELPRVEKELEKFWSIPGVAEWFSTDYRVINEKDILHAGDRKIYRPDRLIIKGDEVTVIDYKFGDSELPVYKHQVKSYMNLLRSMGFKAVGILCYIGLGKVVKIED